MGGVDATVARWCQNHPGARSWAAKLSGSVPHLLLCSGRGPAGSLSGTGSEETVRLGVANFTSVMLRGTINQTYELQVGGEESVSCVLSAVCVMLEWHECDGAHPQTGVGRSLLHRSWRCMHPGS